MAPGPGEALRAHGSEEPARHVNTGALLAAMGAISVTPSTLQTLGQAFAARVWRSAPRPLPGAEKAGEKPRHTADSVCLPHPSVLFLHGSPPCAWT